MPKASDFQHTDTAYGHTWGWNENQQGDPVLITEEEDGTPTMPPISGQ